MSYVYQNGLEKLAFVFINSLVMVIYKISGYHLWVEIIIYFFEALKKIALYFISKNFRLINIIID